MRKYSETRGWLKYRTSILASRNACASSAALIGAGGRANKKLVWDGRTSKPSSSKALVHQVRVAITWSRQRLKYSRSSNAAQATTRSEEHTSNSSHVAISYAVFCLKKKKTK